MDPRLPPDSIHELAESIGRALGVDPVFVQGKGIAGDIICSSDRLRRVFGLNELVSLDEGLARTAVGAPTAA